MAKSDRSVRGEAVVPLKQQAREEELVDRVVASFAGAKDHRTREVLQSLVRHVHAFVRDVRLTEDEWKKAMDFLTAVGRRSDRPEFILLSDVLGVSMQTVAINNPLHGDATEATVFGPFFLEGSPFIEIGGDATGGADGEPCWFEGTVTDTDGVPISGARIEVWQADEEGNYDVQYGDDRVAARAHLFSDDKGHYAFWGLTPAPYPVPADGPVGDLLSAGGRSAMRAAHMHFMVTDGDGPRTHRDLVTHIFVQGDDFVTRDAVFGVRDSLIKEFIHHTSATPTPNGRILTSPTWSQVRFDVVLAPVSA